MFERKTTLFISFIISFAWSTVFAQNFNPAYRVNSQVITYYEIEQMTRLQRFFGTPEGSAHSKAETFLINDRVLRSTLGDFLDQIDANMVKNAVNRLAGDQGADALYSAAAEANIDRSTIDNYATAQILRRTYAQSSGIDPSVQSERTAQRIYAIPDQVTQTVSISEMVIPFAEYGGVTPTRFEVNKILDRLRQGESFASIAREKSRAPTASNGGQLRQIPAEGLNPQLQGLISGLAPGQVSDKIETSGAIVLIRFNGYGEIRTSLPRTDIVSYVELNAGSQAQAQQLKNQIRNCAQAEDYIGSLAGSKKVEDVSTSSLSNDLLLQINRMESGTSQINGNRILFLCTRGVEVPEQFQEAVNARATNEVLDSKVDGLLAQLRASASIIKY